MELYLLENDIRIFYVEADSFPAGIGKAHEALYGLAKDIRTRTRYGVSRPDPTGTIRYKAGTAETYGGEGKRLGCKTLLIKAGTYKSLCILNYSTRSESIGEAFEKILREPDLDPQGYCVEVYEGDNSVRCMVRLNIS